MQDFREKLAQGWTFSEAVMGKGWEAKYPNIANWQGAYSVFGSNGISKISLEAYSGPWFHSTSYTLVEKESSEPDEYRAIDEVIKNWNDEHGEDAILRFKKGWIGETDWEIRYPHIAKWTAGGKRHCIRIKINLVTGKSYAKAWLYDKPSNTETILFERDAENMREHEVLAMLDEGIKNWMSQHEQA